MTRGITTHGIMTHSIVRACISTSASAVPIGDGVVAGIATDPSIGTTAHAATILGIITTGIVPTTGTMAADSATMWHPSTAGAATPQVP